MEFTIIPGGPCSHHGANISLIWFWIILAFLIIYFPYFYLRLFYLKNKIKHFRKHLSFIDSVNGKNPYDIFYSQKIDLGNPAFIKRYILHIFWDIYHKKDELKERKLNSLKRFFQKIFVHDKYKFLYISIFSFFLGFLCSLMEIKRILINYCDLISNNPSDISLFLTLDISFISNCVMYILILALIVGFLSLWIFISSKRLYQWLIIEIDEIDELLMEKYKNE